MTDTIEIPKLKFHAKSGLWFPDNTDPEAGYEYMIKRVTDIDLAVKHCKKTAVAVQAGGNVGMWPLRLAKTFSTVHTFEAVPAIYGALCKNTQHDPSIIAHNKLLSASTGQKLNFSVRSGGVSRVVPSEEPGVEMEATTIDELNLPACDALFLDVEGHELAALAGASSTIDKFRPVITLEVWGDNEDAYTAAMNTIGYSRVEKVHGDRVYVSQR